MRAEVQLFAAAREAAGRSIVEIDIAPADTAADVIQTLANQLPEISALLPSCRLAVDDSYVRQEEVIPAGSDIALIPPVSGG